MEEFGSEQFDHVLKVNFEKNEAYGQVFKRDYDPDRILQELGYLIEGKPADPEHSLVIFDEIQSCPRAITALKYFAESDKSNYILWFTFHLDEVEVLRHDQVVLFYVS